MLVEYQGRRFRVSERTYQGFENDYPERARKLKIIKEAEEYYNYDKLKSLIEPDKNELKKYLQRKYDYYEVTLNERLLSSAPVIYEDNIDELNGKIKCIKEITRDLLGAEACNELN